jgi:hypothetical protein
MKSVSLIILSLFAASVISMPLPGGEEIAAVTAGPYPDDLPVTEVVADAEEAPEVVDTNAYQADEVTDQPETEVKDDAEDLTLAPEVVYEAPAQVIAEPCPTDDLPVTDVESVAEEPEVVEPTAYQAAETEVKDDEEEVEIVEPEVVYEAPAQVIAEPCPTDDLPVTDVESVAEEPEVVEPTAYQTAETEVKDDEEEVEIVEPEVVYEAPAQVAEKTEPCPEPVETVVVADKEEMPAYTPIQTAIKADVEEIESYVEKAKAYAPVDAAFKAEEDEIVEDLPEVVYDAPKQVSKPAKKCKHRAAGY